MMNGHNVNALAAFAGALIFAWHVLAGKSWSRWGEADSALNFIANPAGATVGDSDDDAPFDVDQALARYLEKKAAGEVEPLRGSDDGTDSALAAPRPPFGRKTG
ncbi:MAG: hypothetical protein ABIN72_01400 [Sphingomicrobium sp.]